MTFDEAMSARCSECNRTASWHRITRVGTLYCLTLNGSGIRKREIHIINGKHWNDDMVYKIPVRYLQRSALPRAIGQAIWKGLHDYLPPYEGKPKEAEQS